jgi:hypothetical protein
MKLQKFGKISYSMEIILALKLSSGVSLKNKMFYMINSWLFMPNQNLGARM